jgi:hypothetical protein
VITHDLVREIGVEPHSGPVDVKQLPQNIGVRSYARATGRLVRNPKAMDAIPPIADVAVIKSRLRAGKLSIYLLP